MEQAMRLTKKQARLILSNIYKGSRLEKCHWIFGFYGKIKNRRWVTIGPYVSTSDAEQSGEEKLGQGNFVVIHLNTRDSRNAIEEIHKRIDFVLSKLPQVRKKPK